jgi:hypothetical protein
MRPARRREGKQEPDARDAGGAGLRERMTRRGHHREQRIDEQASPPRVREPR